MENFKILLRLQIVTHEMGHNLGMLHDFDVTHNGKGCNGQGFMSYTYSLYQWSTCSKEDFLAHYNQIVASSSNSWCLPGMNLDLHSLLFTCIVSKQSY